MSETLNELILSTQPTFQELDTANGRLLDFKQECVFALQQIKKNDHTLKSVQQAPLSLKNAIYNVAAIGISLNPALAHAYLVPRDGVICLDVSYRGLVKLATDCGAILWAKTELVYANDQFTWNGPNKEPIHTADPFSERGQVVGGYCIAKLPDGSVMVETMPVSEMNKIQSTSKAANGPWKTWPDEMRKKSVTKRASKSWPQTDNRERIDKAISVLNEHEGIAEEVKPEITYTDEQKDEYQRCVNEKDFFNLAGLIKLMDADSQLQLRSLCAPEGRKGEKMKVKKAFNDNLTEGGMELDAAIHTVSELLEEGDDGGVYEIINDCSPWTMKYVMSKLSQAHQSAITEIQRAGHE